jgi:D-alanyl-D-alanine carboxypeptidase
LLQYTCILSILDKCGYRGGIIITHQRDSHKLYIDIAVIAFVFVALAIFYIVGRTIDSHKSDINKSSQANASFNKQLYSISSPSSIWVIINKQRPLSPINYIPTTVITPSIEVGQTVKNIPTTLQPVAAQAIESMFLEAKHKNIALKLIGGYIPYYYQKGIYDGYLATLGQAAADSRATRPGYDESQVGLSADIASTSNTCTNQTCFSSTPASNWLVANAYKYGYILRYPEGQQKSTGYSYEPWYYRYVGVGLADELHSSGQTMEQFFNLPAALNYKE